MCDTPLILLNPLIIGARMLLFRCLPILLLLLLPDRCGSLALSSGSFKRSYMRRRGQSTKAQKRAMRELWPKYGITLDTGRERSMLDTASIFGRSAPLILDIGHGHGESTVALSKTFSNCDVIGCEVHAPSVGATLLRLESENCSNVRLVRADIFDLMSRLETISGCFVGFPDPWPGARQSSIARRLIRPDFVRMIDQRLCVTSDLPPLSLATDDEEYAIHSRSVLAEAGWDEVYATNRFESRPYWRPISNYERKAMNASRVVWDLAFRPPNM